MVGVCGFEPKFGGAFVNRALLLLGLFSPAGLWCLYDCEIGHRTRVLLPGFSFGRAHGNPLRRNSLFIFRGEGGARGGR